MKERILYKKAVKHWGYPLQLGMAIEECAELIQAINKVQRQWDTDKMQEAVEHLADEVADVEIMMGQLRVMFDWFNFETKINVRKHTKLKKLEDMLNG